MRSWESKKGIPKYLPNFPAMVATQQTPFGFCVLLRRFPWRGKKRVQDGCSRVVENRLIFSRERVEEINQQRNQLLTYQNIWCAKPPCFTAMIVSTYATGIQWSGGKERRRNRSQLRQTAAIPHHLKTSSSDTITMYVPSAKPPRPSAEPSSVYSATRMVIPRKWAQKGLW